MSFSDWLRSAQKNFRTVTASTEALDRVAMERKMKKVEVLNTDTPGRLGFDVAPFLFTYCTILDFCYRTQAYTSW